MSLFYFIPMIACLLILTGVLIGHLFIDGVTRGDWLTIAFFGIAMSITPIINIATLFFCICFALEWCADYLSKTQFWNKPIRSKK